MYMIQIYRNINYFDSQFSIISPLFVMRSRAPKTERSELEKLVKKHSTPQQIVLRARIILLADEGKNHRQIALELKISRDTARHWRRRWLDMAGDEKSVNRELADELVKRNIVECISPRHVGRLLDEPDLKPHQTRGERTLSTYEMTWVQALERKAPDLPLAPGKVQCREFEYIRHGTQALIVNPDVVTGQGGCQTRRPVYRPGNKR